MKPERGFTLIEVMIVVAIIAILAAVSYASYTNQVIKSNRSDAKSALNDVGQRLQRCYTIHGRYNSDDCAAFKALESNGTIDSSEGFYEISGTVEQTRYTLSADPVRAPQTKDDDCMGSDKMTLSHTGQRGGGAACW